jgi:hypothetical protein
MNILQGVLDRLRSEGISAVSDFLRLYARYIYNFPKIRRRQEIVEPGEFYEYVVSMLSDGRRLLQYDPGKGPFDVWFTKVLDNFLNTLTTAKLKQRARFPISDLDIDEIQSRELPADEILEFENERNILSSIFQELNDTEKAIATLHTIFYKDLQPEELEFLSMFTGREPNQLALELEKLLTGELQDEYDRIKEQSKKIEALYRSLQALDSKLNEAQLRLQLERESNLPDQAKVKELESLIQKLEFIEWKKRTRYLQLYEVHRRGKGLVILRNRTIAEFLGLNLGTVTSTITRLRRKFRQLLRQYNQQ